MSLSKVDPGQILKLVFDSTNSALRVSGGVSGSLSGQITWNTGLGAITHILGPTDQALAISPGTGRSMTITSASDLVGGLLTVQGNGGGATLTVYNASGKAGAPLYVKNEGTSDGIYVENSASGARGTTVVNAGTGTGLLVDQNSNAIALQLDAAAASSNPVLDFVNAGSGVDIDGTGSTWSVSKTGAGTFASIVTGTLTGKTDVTCTINSAGTGVLQLGTAGDANAIEISAAGAISLNQAVTGASTISCTTLNPTGITFTGATSHSILGTADQTLIVNSQGTGVLQLGTAGDANAIEISAAGAVAANGALTANETLTCEDDIVLKVNSVSSSSNTLTLDWATGNVFTTTLTENVTTITVNNPTAGHKITIKFVQDGGGGHTVAFPGGWKWPAGTAPTITAAGGSIDVVTVLYDGTDYLADFAQNFS